MPVICYALLIAAEVFATGLMLLPTMSTLAFASLYVLTPALAFFLALLLCATDTKLLLKLPFPVVALAVIPLGLLLRESGGGPITESGHFWADFGLALTIALAPALLGMVIGFIIWAIGRRQRQQSATSKRSAAGKGSRAGGRKPGTNPTSSGPKLRVAPHKKTGRKR
jgi:hypothetical protein